MDGRSVGKTGRCLAIYKKSMLVWDLVPIWSLSVEKKTREMRTEMVIISGGLTSVLQPLDNKTFKENMRQCWTKWMMSGKQELTKAGNMKSPGLALVCEWVVKSWKAISADIVIKSFKKTGISCALDGAEDDMLWQKQEDCASGSPKSDTSFDAYDDFYQLIDGSNVQRRGERVSRLPRRGCRPGINIDNVVYKTRLPTRNKH